MKGQLYCPKCRTSFEPRQMQLSGDEAHVTCPACGTTLTYFLGFGSGTIAESDGSAARIEPFRSKPELSAQWERIRTLPADSPEHDAFLELCFREGALHDLAGAYRALHSEDSHGVARRLRQIEILATMTMTPSARKRVQSRRLGKWIFYILLAFFFMLFMWFLMVTPY